ncbi:hypothetical protein EWM64_g7415 [Hericium alpestre]|uniref:Uncharacterized protein n=1 Tax=Hericium alpestre TaxID=135208 RepID=A0A4Y9ZSY7_9AGAM|nr:hypothetical protein EWM64_g7415 [Hericium alpestre]
MSRRAPSMMPPPPLERDVVMGPPPLPGQAPLATSISQNSPSKDSRENVEKYYKLKRKYFDLEEKHKEMEDELRRSGERNLRMNQERGALLDRILELESLTNGASSNQADPHAPLQPPSTAFPRSLISTRAQTAFASNLREAVEELDTEDTSVDPLLTSRHVGPQARKRREEEMKERAEEEAREARKTSKRKGGPSGAISGKGKDIGAPLTFAPGPSPSGPSGGTSQTLVSTSGKRIRIKPPAPAQAPPNLPPLSSHPGSEGHHTSQFVHNAGIPISLPPAGSPGSPLSSLPSDGGDHYMEYMMSINSSNPSDIQRHAKPKRLKAHTVTSKSYSIPTVPRDRKNRPLLPLNVGIMTVISLGEVCMREHFHTERYIFPVGYEVTRRYLSARDPNAEVVYHCTILDGGDGPKFQIVANDMPDKPIIAGTATGAWSVVNTIKHLIQELPNADRLKDYVWQHFTEGG